jgi:plasmid segregation protein ParM
MKTSETPKVLRALDLGFGFTKFSLGHYQPNGNYELEVSAFPSYAGPAIEGMNYGGNINMANVLRIEVGDQRFSVGKDALNTADGTAKQILEVSFFLSDQYLALARGAMALMKIPRTGDIDQLVTGLPLNVFRDKELVKKVRTRLEGAHVVPDVDLPPGEDGELQNRTIVVKRVQVIPQVVGSLVALSCEDGSVDEIGGQRNLTIDVGYGTLLWLVSNGTTAIPARSNGNMGGVSNLLKKIIKEFAPSSVTNLSIMERLDNALRENQPTIKVHGEDVEIDKYRPLLESTAKENLTEMLSALGDTSDIDNIFLSGGGAHLYKQVIAAAFPKRKIICSSTNSRYTNTKGFQIIAEQ